MSMLRHFLKAVSWLMTVFVRPPRPNVVILMYHRVTGDVPLELDLPFSVFRTQMTRLASTKRVVSLDEAVQRLQSGEKFDKPLLVITFDDAYEDFYTLAFPLMRELGLAVTLYVPTGFIDDAASPPISRRLDDAHKLKPVTWEMLAQMAASPLLTIGSHTHTHPELPSLRDDEIADELTTCDSILQEKLGRSACHFSYPRGVWNARVESLVKRRYATVMLAGGGAIHALDFVKHRIPRIPVLRSDGMFWFSARISGRLIYEERLVATAKEISKKLAAGKPHK